MGPCPYCAEQVGAEARLCRFCNRSLLYSVVIAASMDERQKHEFFRLWNANENKLFKHLPLTSYSQVRKDLDKVPLTIAWDLNLFLADVLEKKFGHLGIEKRLQGGLPSSSHSLSEIQQPSRFANLLYMSLGIGFLSVTIYGAFFHQRPAVEKQTSEQPQWSQMQPSPAAPISQPVYIQTPGHTPPQQAIPSDNQLTRTDIERMLSATVFIKGGSSLGSGFVISSDGHILSNNHVTKTMDNPVVTFRNGQTFKARKIREDPKYDISLIKIDGGNFPYLELGDANEIFAGEPVITIGNPSGLAFTITRGIVSYNGRLIDNAPYIQTDAAINPGNSGGPMINSSMKVIGINTLTATREQGISFSLPINLACDINGIANSAIPRSCPSYNLPGDSEFSAQLGGSPDSDPYKIEANELFENYQREKNVLYEQYEAIKRENQEIQNESAKDPHNQSLQERLQTKNVELVQRAKQVEREMKESDLRYITKTIGLLERQLVDSRLSSYRSQIQAQLDKTRADQKRIIDLLAER